jgi:hypothetical protein
VGEGEKKGGRESGAAAGEGGKRERGREGGMGRERKRERENKKCERGVTENVID